MSVSGRKWLIGVVIALLILPVLAVLVADRWLETSGGRKVLERALAERIGLPVELRGDFDLMLYPSIGVEGTDLVIGEPGAELARSSVYEASLELKPLIDGQVLVEWVRLTDGEIHPGRYAAPAVEPAPLQSGPVALPQIREVTIRDFRVVLPELLEQPLRLRHFTVTEFTENREVPFSLEVDGLFSLEGRFQLDAAALQILLTGLNLSAADQQAGGRGCLDLNPPGSLQLDLIAGRLDLDRLQQVIPAMGQGGAGEPGDSPPMDIRLELAADEVLSSGVTASGVTLRLGAPVDCEALQSSGTP